MWIGCERGHGAFRAQARSTVHDLSVLRCIHSHQVVVDVPRTAPEVAFFHQAPVQRSLERILYIWGVRYVIVAHVL